MSVVTAIIYLLDRKRLIKRRINKMIPKVTSSEVTYRRVTHNVVFEDGSSLVLKLGYAEDGDFDTDYTIIWNDTDNKEINTPDWAKGFDGPKLERIFISEE